MASPLFGKVKLPSGHLYSVPGPKTSTGFGPFADLVGSISSGIDFFSDVFSDDTTSGTGLTSQERRQVKKNNGYRTAMNGVNFGLQTLFTILGFAL